MPSFSGVSFSERGQGGILSPIHGAAGNVGVRVSGNANSDPITDLGGTVLAQLSVPISCGSATLNSLRNETGTDGSLIYAGGTVTAVLVEIKDAKKVVDPTDRYFATLDFIIATATTTIQYPSMTFHAGGASRTAVLEITVSHGTEQDAGQATIVYPNSSHGAAEGGTALVQLGYDGLNATVFSGTVTGRQWDHFPLGIAIDCRDRMEYLTYPYGGTERTYTSTTDGTIVQNLVEAMGIASANTSIEDNGWTVGVAEPVVFRRGDRFLPFIREIDSLAGYVTFTKGADSAIYRRAYNRGATGASTHTLTEGVNVISAQRDLSRDGILNGVQVDGLTYLGATVSVFISASNSDVRNPPGTVAGHVQSNLIENNTRGSTVGSVFLDHHNFKPEQVSFVLPGTAIEPMDMLVVTHSDLGMTGATVVVTQREYKFSSSGYVTNVRAKRPTV